MALHADHEVVRQEHRADRLPLAPREARRLEPRLDGIGVGQRHALSAPRPHRRQHAAFSLHRPVGDEGPVHPPAFHLDQLAVTHKPCDRRVDLRQRVAPRSMAQRHRTDLGLRDRGAPLRDMRHRPCHRLQNATLRLERQLRRRPEARACEARFRPFGNAVAGQLRQRRRALLAADIVGRQVRRGHARHSHLLAGQRVEGPGRPEGHSLPDQPQCLRPRAPFRHEVRESPVLLAPARVQRRHLRILRRVGQLLLFQVFQDRPAPAREGIDERALVTRKLEPRYRPHHARRHRHAERLKAPRQLVPIIRSDQLLAAADLRRLHAPPFPRGSARHVGQHAVGVQLRVLVAARQMPEPRHHHAIRAHPGAAAGRRVPAPGLQKLRLHEVERRAHRLVVSPDHAAVAHHQCLQRHRLRRRQGDVPARPVLVLPLAHPAETQIRPGHVSRQHRFEARWMHVGPEPQRLRRIPVPKTRLAVLGVVPGVVGVALVIDHRLAGRTNHHDRGCHRLRPRIRPRRCAAEAERGNAAGSSGSQPVVEDVYAALEQHAQDEDDQAQ